MKTEDKAYERLIKQIKSHDPVLPNPDELTAGIMENISGLPQNKKSKSRIIQITGWISTVAASLLICFLVSETFFYPSPTKEPKNINIKNQIAVLTRVSTVICEIPELSSPELGLREKSRLLIPCLRKKQQARLSRFSFYNYNPIK